MFVTRNYLKTIRSNKIKRHLLRVNNFMSIMEVILKQENKGKLRSSLFSHLHMAF